MLENMSEKLYLQLTDDIAKIVSNETEPFTILSAVLNCIREALKKLKDHLLKNPFEDQAAQIRFFKHIKPKFCALRIYYLEWYGIVTGIPAGDKKVLKAAYNEELKVIQRFFRLIAFYYQYYRMGATELDPLLFMRGVEVQSVLIPEVPELDPELSTGCDYLFSKIKAYELLQEFVLKQIRELDRQALPEEMPAKKQPGEILTWTGDKVNLVEIIYGLFFTGQLNNGNADIALIIRFMEEHFQVDLSRTYRDFMDIRNRKTTSITRFLEQMQESILAHIDDALALKKAKKQT